MITSKRPESHKIEIDLKGPEGNAFNLLGLAANLSKKIGLETDQILDEMRSGDYENLIQVFDNYYFHKMENMN